MNKLPAFTWRILWLWGVATCMHSSVVKFTGSYASGIVPQAYFSVTWLGGVITAAGETAYTRLPYPSLQVPLPDMGDTSAFSTPRTSRGRVQGSGMAVITKSPGPHNSNTHHLGQVRLEERVSS